MGWCGEGGAPPCCYVLCCLIFYILIMLCFQRPNVVALRTAEITYLFKALNRHLIMFGWGWGCQTSTCLWCPTTVLKVRLKMCIVHCTGNLILFYPLPPPQKIPPNITKRDKKLMRYNRYMRRFLKIAIYIDKSLLDLQSLLYIIILQELYWKISVIKSDS